MKIVGYCLAVVAVFVVAALAVIAGGFAAGYYSFHIQSPRHHVTMRDIERSPGERSHVTMRDIERSPSERSHVTMRYIERSPGDPPLACTAAPEAEAPASE